MKLDDTDRRILRNWQLRPDAPVAEIAMLSGLSHTPCWRRMRKLEAAGVVLGKALLLDASSLGLEVNVFAQLKLQKHDEATLDALELAVQSCQEIVECFSMSGDSDFMMRIVVHSIQGYEIFLKQTLLHLPGVASVNSSFALKNIKVSTSLPV